MTGSSGRKAATLRAIKRCATTSLIWGCAHDRFDAAGNAPGVAARATSRPARRASRRRRATSQSSSALRGPFSLYGVEIEITPEPTADERAALVAALAQAPDGGTDPYRSVWRLAGVLENVESGADAPPPTVDEGSPRSRRGASRA